MVVTKKRPCRTAAVASRPPRLRRRIGSSRHRRAALLFLTALLFLISLVQAGNDDYYAAADDYYAAAADDYYKNDDFYNDDAGGGNDDAAAAADDAAYNDDAAAAANDDDAAANDDAAAANDDGGGGDDDDDDYYTDDDNDDGNGEAAYNEEEQYRANDDDTFNWNSNVGFDGVSVMPLSCINYNSGHMIKFQLFDTEKSYQCHFAEISTFVVSIAHYMRAYFNYQALEQGKDFQLPDDAGYLNCVAMEVDGMNFYGKVGCVERETFTSTKLQLHIYTDQQCSQPYDDGQTARKHATRGYEAGGQLISTKISFKPEFYKCLTCAPDAISGTFNKLNSNWYDDDYISRYGSKQEANDDAQDGNEQNDDGQQDDDQQAAVDDQYFQNYDDGGYAQQNDDAQQDDGYNAAAGDDYYNRRKLIVKSAIEAASSSVLQAYHNSFWSEYDNLQRNLYENNYYDIGDWNMCQRIYKYGVWCDEECRSLDLFRTDRWSASDMILLAIMCTFLTAMMLLVIAKRLKAQQKARMYGDDKAIPGLPPFAMLIIFAVIMVVIVTLAKLKFINETLVFAVVTCILLFIYMLKLTLFETRRPVLLAAPRHDMFDNPLDDHLFE